jgi:hypothetical protein
MWLAILFNVFLGAGVYFIPQNSQNIWIILPEILLALVSVCLILYVALRDPGFINPQTFNFQSQQQFQHSLLDNNSAIKNAQIY